MESTLLHPELAEAYSALRRAAEACIPHLDELPQGPRLALMRAWLRVEGAESAIPRPPAHEAVR